MNAPLQAPSLDDARFETLVQTQVRRHTQAPLRMRGRFGFDAPPQEVFARVTDPGLIATWFGMIRGGSVDHSQSCNVGTWGEGSTRLCNTWGMGDLKETIHHYDAPHACVYSVRALMMPVEQHASLMLVEPTERGCRLQWAQFFVDRGLVMKRMFPSMMPA